MMDDNTALLASMRSFFDDGHTRGYDFRREQLRNLKSVLLRYEHEVYAALRTDLHKSEEETWITETGFVLTELNFALRHLGRWMRKKSVRTNFLNFPSGSFIIKEPLGVVLIIGPWNYPLQLVLTPLIGAIAAGNCAVIKPSELAPATSALIKRMIAEAFPSGFVSVIEGEGSAVIPKLLDHFRFDHIFYTGSTAVGREIYRLAAGKLIPVTLELGGKSPCIVEEDANLAVAARRIAMTKFSNAGQMCVAPDYILVHKNVKDEFVKELVKAIRSFFSVDASTSSNYGRIINQAHYERLRGYLSEGSILYGGDVQPDQRYIGPTILDQIKPDASVMKEEIFGPILPLLSFSGFDEAREIVLKHPNPLALYIFSESSARAQRWLNAVPFGGGCVNNASVHLLNVRLPFGGRGQSGMGAYHGNASFDVFTHCKSILRSPTWIDPKIKYPPYDGKLSLFKRLIR